MAALSCHIPYANYEKNAVTSAAIQSTNLLKNSTCCFTFHAKDKEMRAQDEHPAIMVKDAILARSGVYLYSHEELLASGITPDVQKPVYKIYRPANVIVKSKDKFPFAVVTREHTAAPTTPVNFRDQADGVVGDSVEVVTLENGEVGLKGKIAFYTQDVASYFEQGNKETSADYVQSMVASDSPDYDYIMTDILSVNSIAITAKGRGGSTVRVLDSAKVIDERIGGTDMNILAILFGIGRTKDEAFKLSKIVMDSVAKVHMLDSAGLEKEVDAVMSYVKPLGEGEHKKLLIGAVSDSYKHPVEVLAKKKEVGDVIDKLYARCLDSDEKAAKAAIDEVKTETKDADCSCGKDDCPKCGKKAETKDAKKDEKKDDEGKKAETKDAAALIDEAVDKAILGVKDSMEAMVDASVKKALGIQEKSDSADGKKGADARFTDSVDDDMDTENSFLFQGTFGRR